MDWKRESKSLALLTIIFAVLYFLPLESIRVRQAVLEAIYLLRNYARDHVILCLIPAFFIAGAMAAFIGRASIMKYLGAGANKITAYSVASVSGSILAVCSCTVLPLFAGIYRIGAGLGPATTFLYAGPAINVLAIILTARVLGLELGVARALGAIVFSIVIGLLMHIIFYREERVRSETQMALPEEDSDRPPAQTVLYFVLMIGILVFANWGEGGSGSGLWQTIHSLKWTITGIMAILFGIILVVWFRLGPYYVVATGAATAFVAVIFPGQPLIPFLVAIIGLSVAIARGGNEMGEWLMQTWSFTKQILPLLFVGIILAGIFLGRPGHEGIIPARWISSSVGDNSLMSNLTASLVGSLMYFATLTEIPILQGLVGNGMAKGPALALLLAGPALSLPNMLVIRSVIGTRKTIVFVLLVVVMSTAVGMIYGSLF